MQHLDRIRHHFQANLEVTTLSATVLAEPIALAAERLIQCLLGGYKILACGNGGSAAQAQHFVAELLNRFEIERPSLPALALSADIATITAIANDYAYEEIFAKQLRALGSAGDLLVVLTTSGNSANILRSVATAHERGIGVITLSGNEGGSLANCLSAQDIEIRVPSQSTARIQEVHAIIIHALCDLIDLQLFG